MKKGPHQCLMRAFLLKHRGSCPPLCSSFEEDFRQAYDVGDVDDAVEVDVG